MGVEEAVGFLPGYAGAAQRRAIDGGSSARGLSWGWFLGVVVAVLYGSLIPFSFTPAIFQPSNAYGLALIAVRRATFDDLITNLLIYVPLGLTFVICGWAGRLGRLPRVPIAIGVGALLSLTVETLQVGIALRYASWIDVFLNVVGTAAGAALGALFFGVFNLTWLSLRSRWSRNPFSTVALVLTVGLILFELAPFDFVTSTAALQASFLRAQWGLTSPNLTTLGAPALTPLVVELTGAFWFTILGYVSALAARNGGQTRLSALASSIRNAAMLVVLIEFMQLFTTSHVFELSALVIRINGVVLGAWSAIFIIDSATRSAWMRDPRIALPTLSLLTIGLLHTIGIVICSAEGVAWSTAAVDLSRVHWMPFEVLWRSSSSTAAGVILSTLVTYGTLAAALTIVLRRRGLSSAGWIACVAVVLLSATVEATQALGEAHTADVTIPILALLAAITATKIHATLPQPQPQFAA
jgi:glycopeptide antibiotics resistance protein